MRWKSKYREGDKAINTRFLILPKFIQGEWRWLEKASWEAELIYAGKPEVWVCRRWID